MRTLEQKLDGLWGCYDDDDIVNTKPLVLEVWIVVWSCMLLLGAFLDMRLSGGALEKHASENTFLIGDRMLQSCVLWDFHGPPGKTTNWDLPFIYRNHTSAHHADDWHT